MDDPNPYAAPSDLETTASSDPSALYGQMNGLLAVRNGAELPHVCVVSNQTTNEREWRKKVTLSWAPLWIRTAPSLVLFAFAMACLAAIRTPLQSPLLKLTRIPMFPVLFPCFALFPMLFWKRVKLSYSLDPATRARFMRNRILGIISLALAGCIFVAQIHVRSPWLTSATALVLFATGLFLTNKSMQLRVTKYHDGWFLIKGASPDFVASLPPV